MTGNKDLIGEYVRSRVNCELLGRGGAERRVILLSRELQLHEGMIQETNLEYTKWRYVFLEPRLEE